MSCSSQVALKRQQATEDAIAMGLRAVATGASVRGYLPPGPIFGLPVTEPHVGQSGKSDESTAASNDGSHDSKKEVNVMNCIASLFRPWNSM